MHVTLVRHTRPAVSDGVCYGATDLDVAATFDEEVVQRRRCTAARATARSRARYAAAGASPSASALRKA